MSGASDAALFPAGSDHIATEGEPVQEHEQEQERQVRIRPTAASEGRCGKEAGRQGLGGPTGHSISRQAPGALTVRAGIYCQGL